MKCRSDKTTELLKCHRCYGLKLLMITAMISMYGCALQPAKWYQPGLDESKIATIHRVSKYTKGKGIALFLVIPIPHKLKHETWVYEVDGRTFKFYLPDPDEILVGEGFHTVTLGYERDLNIQTCACDISFKHDISINFFAEGKHEYRFFAYIADTDQKTPEWVWVEDETTGKVVAGNKPPGVQVAVPAPNFDED